MKVSDTSPLIAIRYPVSGTSSVERQDHVREESACWEADDLKLQREEQKKKQIRTHTSPSASSTVSFLPSALYNQQIPTTDIVVASIDLLDQQCSQPLDPEPSCLSGAVARIDVRLSGGE